MGDLFTQFGGENIRLVDYDEHGRALVVGLSVADSLLLSEFGEIQTAPPGNRADVEFTHDKQPLLVDDISSGNGTATHDSDARDVVLAVGGGDEGDTGGLRLHYNVPYSPGSGQAIDITSTIDGSDIGGGTAYTFLRSTVSGETVTTLTEQSKWKDPVSNINWAYSQIFRISFQSLKVGRIQYPMSRSGGLTKVTQVTNDNVRATGYWQYPSLPPYWKIYNTATNTIAEVGYGDEANGVGYMYIHDGIKATATMRAICTTVKSQGGLPLFDMPGFPFATSNKNTPKTVSTTLIPLLSLQVSATINSIANVGLYIPESFSLQTNNPIRYQVLYRPALTNASFAAVDATYSGMSFDTSATALTGGVLVAEDYLSSGNNQITGEEGILGRTIMSLGYNGTSDIVTIAGARTGGVDATVYSALRWREIR